MVMGTGTKMPSSSNTVSLFSLVLACPTCLTKDDPKFNLEPCMLSDTSQIPILYIFISVNHLCFGDQLFISNYIQLSSDLFTSAMPARFFKSVNRRSEHFSCYLEFSQ